MNAHTAQVPALIGLILLLISADTLAECEVTSSAPPPRDQTTIMFLANLETPFVTREMAEKLALLVLAEKYSPLFAANLPVTTDEKCDAWLVTVRNKDWSQESASAGSIKPKQLTIWIRKRDAAILDIT
jgi:hypothetical protein